MDKMILVKGVNEPRHINSNYIIWTTSEAEKHVRFISQHLYSCNNQLYGLRNSEVQCRICEDSQIIPIQSRINSFSRIDTCFFKIRSNIVLPSTPRPSYIYILKIKLNLWLTAPKGAKPVNQTPATDWQMAARRDNVISITLRQVY